MPKQAATQLVVRFIVSTSTGSVLERKNCPDASTHFASGGHKEDGKVTRIAF